MLLFQTDSKIKLPPGYDTAFGKPPKKPVLLTDFGQPLKGDTSIKPKTPARDNKCMWD